MNRQLQEFARHGAQSRLAALDQERDEILKMFPELRNGAGRDGGAPQGRKDHLSPEARKRQAERMRAYWAERRAEKAAADGTARKSSVKKSAPKAKRKSGMSAEARKAQGERMKAYWAAKRAEQAASGAQAEAAGPSSGSASTKTSGRKAGRKQGRKK